jgi:hypothetical protein
MDQASQRIRDKLWYGILPNVTPAKRWGTFGTGRMYDVELPDGRRLSFHLNCASLWQVLRMALPE